MKIGSPSIGFGILLLGVTAVLASGCFDSGGPSFDRVTTHSVQLSDNVVTFSLPRGGLAPPPFENHVELNVNLKDDGLYTESGYLTIGVANYDWKPLIQVNGSLTVLIKVQKRVASVGRKGMTLGEILTFENLNTGDENHRQLAEDHPTQFKGVVSFSGPEPKWLRHDFGNLPGLEDQGEDFAHPLDDDHILIFRFRFTDNSMNDPVRREWYTEAEHIADQIMASVAIETGSVESTLEWGAPDFGVATGRIRYLEDLSTREDLWSPEK